MLNRRSSLRPSTLFLDERLESRTPRTSRGTWSLLTDSDFQDARRSLHELTGSLEGEHKTKQWNTVRKTEHGQSLESRLREAKADGMTLNLSGGGSLRVSKRRKLQTNISGPGASIGELSRAIENSATSQSIDHHCESLYCGETPDVANHPMYIPDSQTSGSVQIQYLNGSTDIPDRGSPLSTTLMGRHPLDSCSGSLMSTPSGLRLKEDMLRGIQKSSLSHPIVKLESGTRRTDEKRTLLPSEGELSTISELTGLPTMSEVDMSPWMRFLDWSPPPSPQSPTLPYL